MTCVDCHLCEGTGRRELVGITARVMAAARGLVARGQPITTRAVHAALELARPVQAAPSAARVSMELGRLGTLGLLRVKRRTDRGVCRGYTYTLVESAS